MKNVKRRIVSLLIRTTNGLLIGTAFLLGCKKDNPPIPNKNIIQVASDNANFSTLVAAVNKTGLTSILSSGATELTVFAPTNEAFTKLTAPFKTAASIEAITDANQVDNLRNILLYHVVESRNTTDDYSLGLNNEFSQNKAPLFIWKSTAGLFINGSIKVTRANLPASNGIIHAIDQVLLPPTESIAAIVKRLSLASSPAFTALDAAIQKTGLTDMLTKGKYTIFAPTDEAFARLPAPYQSKASIEAITDPAQINFLKNVLLYHLVASPLFLTDLTTGNLTTLAASPNNRLSVNNFTLKGVSNNTPAKITFAFDAIIGGNSADELAANGVIHKIDQVLLP